MRAAEQYLYFYNIRADNSFLVVRHREVIRSVMSSPPRSSNTLHPYITHILCVPFLLRPKINSIYIWELLVFIFMD